MARNKKRKTRAQERVLESVFGIELEGVSGDHASPAPQPDPAAATDIEAQAEAIAQKHERAAHLAEIRAAAVDVAKTARRQARAGTRLCKAARSLRRGGRLSRRAGHGGDSAPRTCRHRRIPGTNHRRRVPIWGSPRGEEDT
jgi:hypothetical protein